MAPKIKVTIAIVLVLICVTLPYILAAGAAGGGQVFGGLLFNPLDGNSYLAKMQLGYQGEWRFRLLYSPPEGEGAYIFLFYLALGHLARLSGVPVVWVFHLARVASALCLLVALWKFFEWAAGGDEQKAWRSFLLAAAGSGLGWLVSLAGGYLTGDFWIPEAYPFLSMYANVHFPLGLALILWLSLRVLGGGGGGIFLTALLSLVLGIVQPFGVVVLALPLAGFLAADVKNIPRETILASIAAMAPGGLYLVYQYAVILGDPALAAWNRQNQTLTPPAWDVLASFSPALLLALPGAVLVWRSGHREGRTLAFWLAAGLVLVYLPFSLQRRFLTGLYVPVSGLAVVALEAAVEKLRRRGWLFPGLFAVSILTNVLLILSGLGAAFAQDPILYLSRPEMEAVTWLGENTPPGSLVLASARMGMFIPAWSGRNVLYGHPFESLNAAETEQKVTDFLTGKMNQDQMQGFVETQAFDYALAEESAGGKLLSALPGAHLVFQSGGVSVFSFQP